MIFITTEEVILLHKKLIVKTGGLNGVRDISMLESVILNRK